MSLRGGRGGVLGNSARGAGAVTEDELYQLLSNRRRRYVIHRLRHDGERTDIGSLAERVAAWENGCEVDELTAAERKTAYTALHQRHLPKLDDAGIVEFDKARGAVEPTDAVEDVAIYTEVVEGRDVPWSAYYLALAVVGFGATAAGWAGVGPFVVIPDVAGGLFCSVALALSALVHHHATRQSRLGSGTRPPEKATD